MNGIAFFMLLAKELKTELERRLFYILLEKSDLTFFEKRVVGDEVCGNCGKGWSDTFNPYKFMKCRSCSFKCSGSSMVNSESLDLIQKLRKEGGE